jgi:hypothetical protein
MATNPTPSFTDSSKNLAKKADFIIENAIARERGNVQAGNTNNLVSSIEAELSANRLKVEKMFISTERNALFLNVVNKGSHYQYRLTK